MAPLYLVLCSPQSSTKSHQASRRAPQGVEWALCRTYSVHFCLSAMVAPISLWPPGGQYCLTVTALWGVGNTCGGCFVYPLISSFTTRTWRWNSPTDIRNTRPFKTSTPKIHSGNGDMYTVYTCTESHPISNGKDTAFTSMFWPP